MTSLTDSIRERKRVILENVFFRPSWYSIFLNPYFINRNSLYKGIREFAANTKENSAILDVGCGLKPYRFLFKTENYLGIDIETGGHSNQEKHVDKFYDGENIPFDDRSFDVVICTQVLEHAYKPEKIIAECSRVLRPDGKIFISMPFVYPEHEIPFDFQRFTKYKLQRLLEANNFVSIDIKKTTGFFGTFGQLFSVLIFESITFRATVFKTLLSIVILAPIQMKALLLDFIFSKAGPTMDYIVTAKKNGSEN